MSEKSIRPPRSGSARGGRPPKEVAARRQRELLDKAMEIFLDQGFEHTTIRDVAAAVKMTRKTIYSRYSDKRELFRAVLENGAEQMVVPADEIEAVPREDLRFALVSYAKLRAARTLTPAGIQLQRFIYAHAHRYPDMVHEIYAKVSEPTYEKVLTLLIENHAAGRITIGDPVWTARMLMTMALNMPINSAVRIGLDELATLDDQIEKAVDLFLNGVQNPENA